MASKDYGVVLITGGPQEGRIGVFDDKEGAKAVVYLGHRLFAVGYHLIPTRHLSIATTADLMRRYDELYSAIGLRARSAGPQWRPDPANHIELLTELTLVQNEIAERLFNAQFSTARTGRRIFISYSSKDRSFARLLAIDLASRGHRPWLDEWKILAGQSIPNALSQGIDGCDVLVVVLSEQAVESKWVQREWQAKYWDEVNSGELKVIPALLRNCKIPVLLRSKKYADFTASYNQGLTDILASVARARRRRSKGSEISPKVKPPREPRM